MVKKSLNTRALSSKRIEAARREEVVASSTTATAGIHTDIAPTSQGLGAGEEDFLFPKIYIRRRKTRRYTRCILHSSHASLE
ncbi:hypothetical protein PtA15_8A355 [Puccinia triticina]|uniref:Uncharacterized protein n=1 Tax=Puccinia triticina TaxID=208348 RepID=A0ABY7CQB8_9BASI|nr:uncharacterized protein PtA15_8A355 [Puccinia triticina]WAQ87451.1 hypothetical protein PtA15_8A355 [Puccinia triticina]WAR57304.1 hypothetical protein PtB15_8B351 [Puccinia triticina]